MKVELKRVPSKPMAQSPFRYDSENPRFDIDESVIEVENHGRPALATSPEGSNTLRPGWGSGTSWNNLSRKGSDVRSQLALSDAEFKRMVLANREIRSRRRRRRILYVVSFFILAAIGVGVLAMFYPEFFSGKQPTTEVPSPSITESPFASSTTIVGEPLEGFLSDATNFALNHLFEEAINPEGENVLPGTIKASPALCPDHSQCWVRDQAIVYGSLLEYYEDKDTSTFLRTKIEQTLRTYVEYVEAIFTMNQGNAYSDRLWNQWETKYELNGSMFLGDWSVQSDGPALRSIMLMRFAQRLVNLKPSEASYVNSKIKPLVLQDLDFLTVNWNEINHDPWEEVSGQHFTGRLLAHQALQLGSLWLGYSIPSGLLETIESTIRLHHFDTVNTKGVSLEVISPSVPEDTSVPDAKSMRTEDIQVFLAVLHGNPRVVNVLQAKYLTPSTDQVLSSLLHSILGFEEIYPINQLHWEGLPFLSPAIGRFLEDRYNGGDKFTGDCLPSTEICPLPCEGQPWFVTTATVGEVLFRALESLLALGSFDITTVNRPLYVYIGAGDFDIGPVTRSGNPEGFEKIALLWWYTAESFVRRIQHHSDNFHMSEQYNGITGEQMSAGDLAWSYASLLTLTVARKYALQGLENAIPGLFEPVDTASDVAGIPTEIVVTNVPIKVDNSDTIQRMVLIGDEEELGYDDPCTAPRALLRRSVQGYYEYSAMVNLYANRTANFQLIHIEETGNEENSCNVVTRQPPGYASFKIGTRILPSPLYSVWCEDCTAAPIPPLFPDTKIYFVISGAENVNPGEFEIAVTGNAFQLGSWDPCSSRTVVAIKQSNGMWATAPFKLEANWSLSFKPIRRPKSNCKWDSVEGEGNVIWHQGENYRYTIPPVDLANPEKTHKVGPVLFNRNVAV